MENDQVRSQVTGTSDYSVDSTLEALLTFIPRLFHFSFLTLLLYCCYFKNAEYIHS